MKIKKENKCLHFMSDACDELNKQEETIQELNKENYGLLDGYDSYKALYLSKSEEKDNISAEYDDYQFKVKEILQKYFDEYLNKEHRDISPLCYASEVIDDIAEELGVELE
ncbi:hypothetical protein [Methanobrevibacter sp. V14]|uniref:hypothetical protein n=1 Tax=Methanobrevibacter sp. V14 TaxID=3064280 RepID=UPI00273593EF|nr:hypothetical protein [Methanobrevibacter sp. V14]